MDKTALTADEAESLFNRRFLAYFALFLTIAGMTYVACVTFMPIPKDNGRYADLVLGFIMGTVLTTPIAFFFASSKSSQAKDQALSALLPSAPPPTPTVTTPTPTAPVPAAPTPTAAPDPNVVPINEGQP
jgi:hypothetical protein